PDQVDKATIFQFIESELIAVESELVEAGQNEYGRVDQAVAWMILAKLYLNAEVYIGEARYTDCITYCQKIIDAGFELDDSYASLFTLENVNSNEILFTINFDGNNTQTYGGMTFLVHAAIGGTMSAADYGVNSGWSGLRTTKNLVDLFPDATGNID